MTTALFLLDAGPTVGLGHVRRSMRLLQAMRDRGVNCRVMVPAEAVLPQSWRVGWECWPQDLADLPAADIIVADSYRLPVGTVAAWGERTRLRVIVDDLADRTLPAEVVLNHNLTGEHLDYSQWSPRLVLRGLKWSLIDPAFVQARAARLLTARRTALISFGGVDSAFGLETAKAVLAAAPGAQVALVIPPGGQRPSYSHDMLALLESPDMAVAMAQAGTYVGAAGITALEACAASMSMAICSLWDNQIEVVRAFASRGLVAMDRYDPERLAAAAASSLATGICENPLAACFDGLGAQRAVAAILDLLHIPSGLGAGRPKE